MLFARLLSVSTFRITIVGFISGTFAVEAGLADGAVRAVEK